MVENKVALTASLGLFLVVVSGTSFAHINVQKDLLSKRGQRIDAYSASFDDAVDSIYNTTIYPNMKRLKKQSLDDLFINEQMNQLEKVELAQVGIILNEAPDPEPLQVVRPKNTYLFDDYIWDIYDQGVDKDGNYYRLWAGFKAGKSMEIVTESLQYDPNTPEAMELLTDKQRNNMKVYRLREAQAELRVSSHRPNTGNDVMNIKEFEVFQASVRKDIQELKKLHEADSARSISYMFWTMWGTIIAGAAGIGMLFISILSHFRSSQENSRGRLVQASPPAQATRSEA